MMYKKHKLFLGVILGVSLFYIVLQVGVGSKRVEPRVPEFPEWFQTTTNLPGQRAVLLEGDQAMVLFMDRLEDFVPNMGAGSLQSAGTMPSTPMASIEMMNARSRAMRGIDEEDGGLLGGLPGAPEMPDHSGWGWLADGVQEQREASNYTPSRDESGDIMTQRRLFSNESERDGSFSSRRWFDE